MFGLEIIVIFVVIWWLVLFTILPLGVQKEDKILGGNDPGAPKKSLVKKKAIISSLITFFLTAVAIVIKNEIF